MIKRYSFLLAIVLTACHSENPFITKQQAEAILKEDEIKPVEYVAAIVNDNVYWIRNFDTSVKKINGLPGGSKSDIRISHDHSQIALILENAEILITDTLGSDNIIVPIGGEIKQYDWSQNDETLWMLINNDIAFYGPPMEIPDLEREPEEQILSATITPQNDVLYIVERAIGLGRYSERLEFRGHDGSARTINKMEGETQHMATVRLSKDGEYFVIGYTRDNNYEYLAKVEIYPVDEGPSIWSYDTDYYFDAVYDFKSKFVVTATAQSDFDEYYLAALYTQNEALGPDENKFKFDYKAEVGEIYVDWK